MLAIAALVYVLVADSDGMPENLLIPLIIVIITIGLESIYFWTTGDQGVLGVLRQQTKL